MKYTNKEELRAAVLERRDELDDDTIERASALFCDRLEAHPVYSNARGIAGYAAIRGELDPSRLLTDALDEGRSVYLPRVIDAHHLEFARFRGFDALEEGPFGVMEPQGPAEPLRDIDLFFVPGVGFDRDGGRIGFGRGYYDRVLGRRLALAGDDPTFVGCCYEWQLVDDIIPVESHDVAMHYVATDNAIIKCRSTQR